MSKKLKLSPWHDGSVAPVNVGVYEVKWRACCNYQGGEWFNFWDGEMFCIGSMSAENASKENRLPKSMKPIQWRGILK